MLYYLFFLVLHCSVAVLASNCARIASSSGESAKAFLYSFSSARSMS